MKTLIKTSFGKIILALLAGLLLLCAGVGGLNIWLDRQLKFQDVTIELGTQRVGVEDFATDYARLSRCRFVGDISGIDIGTVGTHAVTIAHGNREQTVLLTVEDTTAPEVTFLEKVVIPAGAAPRALDFVENFRDYSETRVYFAKEPVLSEDYGDVTVTVVVEDAWGNKAEKDCVLGTSWIHEHLEWELGRELTKGDILMNPDKDGQYIDQAALDVINASSVGTYTVTAETPSATMECTVVVQDTTAPELKLREVSIYPGNHVTLKDFVASCEDAAGEPELRLLTQLDNQTIGHHTVTLEAEDVSGNVTTLDTVLIVSTDKEKPELSGLTELSVRKHSKPDFLDGVTAKDAVDGDCEVQVDESKVDMTKAGTYYLTYTAKDLSGNEVTAKRKVTVEHDEEDTALLVAELAATLENDPEKIRDYVRGNIGYNSNWGGDDPVWYGFKNRAGNCYVHALAMDAIMQYYGYETQLIWVKDKSHYWLLVNLEGIGWRHMDPTPSELHGRYSIMTDQQRYWTLSGRDWDRTAWPECVEPEVTETTAPTEETTPETTTPTEVTEKK